MKGLKITYILSLAEMSIIFCFLCFFFFYQKDSAWPQEAFLATLELERIDSGCENNEVNKCYINFGFDLSGTAIPSPPKPINYCLLAFIDPNHTSIDGEELNFSTQYGTGWFRTILPFPEHRACWGIKVLFKDPNRQEPGRIRLNWDPNELKGEGFELLRGKCGMLNELVDMKEETGIELDNIVNGEIIRIKYSNADCVSSSLIAIICVGGEELEGKQKGRFDAFQATSDLVYRSLFYNSAIASFTQYETRKEYIRYIFYHNSDLFVDHAYDEIDFYPSNQKERLKNSITLWPVEEWLHCPPKFPTFFIYIVGHGVPRDDEVPGYIHIDPFADPNLDKLYASELNEWLNILEYNLQSNDICDYEIFTFIESCSSNDFLYELWHPDPNEPQNSFFPKRIFITTAQGRSAMDEMHSFSWDFWINLDNTTDLSEAFKYAKDNYDYQNPQIRYDKSNYKEMSEFYLNRHMYKVSHYPIPYINKIEIDPNVIDPNNPIIYKPSFLTFSIDIGPRFLIEEILAVIVPPGCSDASCRKYIDEEEMNLYYFDANINKYIFQPDYYFWSPGRYEVDFFAKGENNIISISKIYFFNVDATDFKDNYETDNDSVNAKIFSEEFQIHSFHDENDIDWVKFPAPSGEYYEICFKPFYTLPTDPNLAPCQITVSTGYEENILELNTKDDYSYTAQWHNLNKDALFTYLKISPTIHYQGFLPYKLTIQIAGAGLYAYIIGRVDKRHSSIVGDLYLIDSRNQKCDPDWFLDINSSESLYFIFHCIIKIPSTPPHLWLQGNELGPLDIRNIYLNLEEIHVEPAHSSLPYTIDDDCDGIVDEDDPDSDQFDIILHPGLNLFRYPLWTGSEPGADLCKIFYNPNVISPNDSDKIKGIHILSDQKNKWEWNYYNSNSSEICLPDKSGCLIYLDSNTNLRIPLIGISNLNEPNNKLGKCLKELDPNIQEYSKINLNPALNVIGFIGYKIYFVDYQDPNNPKISFDFWIPADNAFNSYSVIHSLSESASFNQVKDPNFVITRYDNRLGKWESSYSFFGRASGKQVKIKINEAYLIYSKEKKDAWLPYHKLYNPY